MLTLRLLHHALGGNISNGELLRWLRRQFKRTAMVDGAVDHVIVEQADQIGAKITTPFAI
jgi:hypothetical protein